MKGSAFVLKIEIVGNFLQPRPFCLQFVFFFFLQLYVFPRVYLQFAIDPAAGL